MYHSLFICSSTGGHFSCFQILAIVSKTTADIRVQALCGRKFSLSWINMKECSCSRTRNKYVYFCEKTAKLSCKVAMPVPFCILPSDEQESLFYILTNFWYLQCLGCWHPNRWVVISHCCFNLKFLSDTWRWASIHIFTCHLHILFGEMSVQVFCPF